MTPTTEYHRHVHIESMSETTALMNKNKGAKESIKLEKAFGVILGAQDR